MERPFPLNNQLGAGDNARLSQKRGGMLPKTAISGGARRGGHQNIIFRVMGHLGASFDKMGTGSDGRLIEIHNNQIKKQKVLSENAEVLLCSDPFALLDFLAGNSKCKYAAKPYKASINYFKH